MPTPVCRELICPLNSLWPARRLSALCGQQDQTCQMTHNSNAGEQSKSSSRSGARATSSGAEGALFYNITQYEADARPVDGGRCGRAAVKAFLRKVGRICRATRPPPPYTYALLLPLLPTELGSVHRRTAIRQAPWRLLRPLPQERTLLIVIPHSPHSS